VIGSWRIHGHAIVSADDRIASPDGLTPLQLRNQTDWERFQRALDEAVVTVLGRLGHAANPNRRGRNRLVLSSSAAGVERRADGWWWNPTDASLEEALRLAAPGGGIVAVPGGRRVFDLFLAAGFDEFHLARARSVLIPDGVPIFSSVGESHPAEAVLAASGLAVAETEVIDSQANVTLTRWYRPAGGVARA